MMSRSTDIEQTLRPTVEAMGYLWWGLEWVGQATSRTLRIYIDHENSIGVEDCAEVSRQISALLDVEDKLAERYYLEVSSPGMDRRFFRFEQLLPYVGQLMTLKTRLPVQGRSRFKGRLLALDSPKLSLCTDESQVTEQIYLFDFSNVDSLRLIPVF